MTNNLYFNLDASIEIVSRNSNIEYNGKWFDGTFYNGTFVGNWYGGKWSSGDWVGKKYENMFSDPPKEVQEKPKKKGKKNEESIEEEPKNDHSWENYF